MAPALLNDLLNKKVLTKKGLHTCAGVKRTPDLKDICFMELYASLFNYPCAQFLTIPTLLVVAVGDQANSVPSADHPCKASKMIRSPKTPANLLTSLVVPYKMGLMMHTSMT